MESPVFSWFISRVLLPTPWTISVMVPSALFESTIVKGILSPPSFRRTITNCPAFRFAAIRGARMRYLLMSGAMNSAWRIKNIRQTSVRQLHILCQPAQSAKLLDSKGLGYYDGSQPTRHPDKNSTFWRAGPWAGVSARLFGMNLRTAAATKEGWSALPETPESWRRQQPRKGG